MTVNERCVLEALPRCGLDGSGDQLCDRLEQRPMQGRYVSDERTHIRLAAYFPVPFNNNTPLAPCCLFPVVLLRPCPEP